MTTSRVREPPGGSAPDGRRGAPAGRRAAARAPCAGRDVARGALPQRDRIRIRHSPSRSRSDRQLKWVPGLVLSPSRRPLVGILDSYASDPVGGGEPLTTEVRARLAVGLQNHPTTLILLALMSDCPVGVAICFLGFSTFKARPLLNVHDLAVIPEWRGKGIGRALLAAAEARAVDTGCCKLNLGGSGRQRPRTRAV